MASGNINEERKKGGRYVPVSEQEKFLPSLASTNVLNRRTQALCRYHCGYECNKAAMVTHQQKCKGRPTFELEHYPGIAFGYTCKHCQWTCFRMFDMLKHIKFDETCVSGLPALTGSQRKRTYPITTTASCRHCNQK